MRSEEWRGKRRRFAPACGRLLWAAAPRYGNAFSMVWGGGVWKTQHNAYRSNNVKAKLVIPSNRAAVREESVLRRGSHFGANGDRNAPMWGRCCGWFLFWAHALRHLLVCRQAEEQILRGRVAAADLLRMTRGGETIESDTIMPENQKPTPNMSF